MPEIVPKPVAEPTCGICGVCESWHSRTGCDKWTPVAAPKPPGRLKKMLGKIRDAVGEALGEAFVNR
jgi:hypothetical protein